MSPGYVRTLAGQQEQHLRDGMVTLTVLSLQHTNKTRVRIPREKDV